MMILRPHQVDAIAMLRDGLRAGNRRQILSMPTGAGKTAVAVQLARNARDKAHLTYLIVDRIELALQAAEAMRGAGLVCSILQGQNTRIESGHDVVVASVQTLARRALPAPGLLIVDEAHVLHRAHIAMLERWPSVPGIGLTATPYTRGLGRHFSNLVAPTSVRDLTAQGLLVPMIGYGPSRPDLAGVQIRGGDYVVGQLSARMSGRQITADLVRTWERLGEGRSTVIFCCDIAHARSVAETFSAAGIEAAHVDGYQNHTDRRATIDRFKRGDLRVLASVACLSVGFDAPIASCAILARPTKSLTLHLQQLGRVLRPHAGKVDALILDHAGNVEAHGWPEDIEIAELDMRTKTWRTTARPEKNPKPCPACSRMKPAGIPECPACGFRLERQAAVETVDGELVPLRGKAAAELQKRTYREFLGLALEWRKRPGWAYYLYRAKFGKGPGGAWKNLEPISPGREAIAFARAQQIRHAKAAVGD